MFKVISKQQKVFKIERGKAMMALWSGHGFAFPICNYR